MAWFHRLGLQRRIMLYVGIGLALMTTIGAYLGFQAIQQATELLYQERLTTAFTVASMLEQELQEFINDGESERAKLLKAQSLVELQEIADDLFERASNTTTFSFVHAQSLHLVDQAGRGQVAIPISTETMNDPTLPDFPSDLSKPVLVPPSSSLASSQFGTLLVPIKDVDGVLRWTLVLNLAALNRDEPFSISSSGNIRDAAPSGKSATSYGLEVIGPDGRVVFTRKGGTAPGKVGSHSRILQNESPQPRGPFVFLHKPQGSQKFPPHIFAAVPITSGPFVLILEQPEDVALALPIQLRQRLILLASFGFLATMLVAWVTTRHVVKPTERLTAAAELIAEGKVETPITVVAQDEIGALAESLEIMRLRLQAWGSELEKQVQERTSELKERNRELSALYETLQQKETQLRALLVKVLGAQEDERKRVSRELHDGIGQALSALALGLGRLEQARTDRSASFEEQIEKLKTMADETLSDLRRLTVALRPAALDDLGLVPAIRRYAELYLGDAGITFNIQEEGLTTRLDSFLETIVYRVVQEAINNVVKHSEATQVGVLLQFYGEGLVATVRDDGRGFIASTEALEQGVGLQGMQERAFLAGGRLTVESQPGNGTVVRLEIPLGEKGDKVL